MLRTTRYGQFEAGGSAYPMMDDFLCDLYVNCGVRVL